MSIPITILIKRPAELTNGGLEPEETAEPDRRLAVIWANHGKRFLALRRYLSDRPYWDEDMHWNGAGHRVVASLMNDVTGA